MLEYLNANDRIEAFIWFGNGRDVADDVQVSLIPCACLQSNLIALAIILAEILGHIVKM